jgi:hypothetical protein
MLDREHYYPGNRAEAVSAEQITAQVLESIIEDDEPLDVAHEEDVKAWVIETLDRVKGKPRSLSSLSRNRSIVQVWLSILLSEGKLTAYRSRGGFYDQKGIIVVAPTI